MSKSSLIYVSILAVALFIGNDLLSMEKPPQPGQEQRDAKKARHVLLAPEIPPTMNEIDAALLEASATGDEEGVLKVLANEANINARDLSERTPLFMATANGYEEIVKLLIERKCKIDAANKNGWNSLLVAADKGHEGMARALLEAGAQKDGAFEDVTPLHAAAARGHQAVVKLLLESRAQIEAATKIGVTPLYTAAQYGQEAVVRLLLDGGANATTTAKDGSPPLYAAAFNGNAVIVRLLLEKGGRMETANKDGFAPLHIAVSKGHTEVVRLLLERNARIDTPTRDGSTALHGAARRGHESVVRLLLEKGAQIETRSELGTTPLYDAVCYVQEPIVRILRESGAQIDAPAQDGWTPLHAAAYRGHEAIVRLLLDRSADGNARKKDGSTPLMIAANEGHSNIIQALLAHPHIEINATNEGGKTALTIARVALHTDVAQLLYRYGAEDFGSDGLLPAPPRMSKARREQRRRRMILESIVINPLHRAAASENLEELENSLRTNRPLDEVREAILYAAGRGHTQTVNRLLQAGADPRGALEMIKIILQRPLLTPQERRQFESIRKLLINRLPTLLELIVENPELRAKLMGTRFYALPGELRKRIHSRQEQLLLGILADRIDEVRAALQAEADPNARDAHGNPALWVAVLTDSSQEFMHLLLPHGADPTVPVEGQTLIQWAARRQNQQLVGDLLLLGARAPEEIVRTYVEGRVAPEAALGRAEEVARLVADPTIERQELQSTLLYAAAQSHEAVVGILLTAADAPQAALHIIQTILRRRGISALDAARYQTIAQMLSKAHPVAPEGAGG